MTKNPAKKRPTTTAATLCVIFLATVILKMTTLGTRETRSHDTVERSASDGISRWRPKITMKMIFSNVVRGGGGQKIFLHVYPQNPLLWSIIPSKNTIFAESSIFGWCLRLFSLGRSD